ncbi:MAG: DinB family protein [Planctomycetota bacterium]|jgi:uncharacterized damage-inducible protein DinB
MNWTALLNAEIEDKFQSTAALLGMVDDSMLGWKPPSGENWMTMGQLIWHLPEACGFCMRGFVTEGWELPAAVDPADAAPEGLMPQADDMRAATSADEVVAKFAEDKELAHAMVAEAGEERLANEVSTAPWDPRPMPLGQRLLGMVEHLTVHRAQLFYYLKLMGKPVGTKDMYGVS